MDCILLIISDLQLGIQSFRIPFQSQVLDKRGEMEVCGWSKLLPSALAARQLTLQRVVAMEILPVCKPN